MNLFLTLLIVIVGTIQLESAEIGSSRIIGGKDVRQADWSFMVSLQNYTEVTFLWQKYPVYQHFCAGTLTALNKFITAAHCVAGITDFRNFSIYAGVSNLQDTKGERKLFTCAAPTAYVAGYPGVGDVVLCTLPDPFVAPVAAFSATSTARISFRTIPGAITATAPATLVNGTVCKAAGWGSLSMVNLGTGFYSNALQELSVTILDVTACNRMWPKTTITTSHICTQQVAFSGNCYADSGGPLICGAENQVGMILGGNTICAVGQPDIYTKLTTAFAPYA